MKDSKCIVFLQEYLPRMRMRWTGFRKVRGQVCKRIKRRLDEIGIAGIAAYREYIESHPAELETLYMLCRVTISRFYRDRGVFDAIRSTVLPAVATDASARGESEVRAWSAGCASGEEAYTLRIIWKLSVTPAIPDAPPLHVTATDVDSHLFERARVGLYPASSLRDLPADLKRRAFDETEAGFRIRETFKKDIHFLRQDIRTRAPDRSFHLIMCRNFVFTYFDGPLQSEMLQGIIELMRPGGFLVIGTHETLPLHGTSGIDLHTAPCIFKKHSGGSAP